MSWGEEGKKLKIHISNRDGFNCVYCGIKTRFASGASDLGKDRMTIEHVIPKMFLKTEDHKTQCNLVIACQQCNHKRGVALNSSVVKLINGFSRSQKKQMLAMLDRQGNAIGLRPYQQMLHEDVFESASVSSTFNLLDIPLYLFARSKETKEPFTFKAWFQTFSQTLHSIMDWVENTHKLLENSNA